MMSFGSVEVFFSLLLPPLTVWFEVYARAPAPLYAVIGSFWKPTIWSELGGVKNQLLNQTAKYE